MRGEKNKPAAPVSKLNPRDGDHRPRSDFGIIGANFDSETEWIDARKRRLINSTPPQSQAVERVSNSHRSSNSNPSVFGQLRSEGLKGLFHAPRETSDMNVKLVLGPRKA